MSFNEPKRLLDAENIIIPHLRARFDGDPIHDQITYVIQQEHHSETNAQGIPGITTRTYLIALFNITGIMFNHKEQIPDLFLKDQGTIIGWADRSHRRFIDGLVKQMTDFIQDTSKAAESLTKISDEMG